MLIDKKCEECQCKTCRSVATSEYPYGGCLHCLEHCDSNPVNDCGLGTNFPWKKERK